MAKLLKDLYDENYLNLLTTIIQNIYIDFDTQSFTKTVFNESWEELELKNRMRHISTTLGEFLPQEYAEAITILKKAFLQIGNPMYKLGLENMIFQDFVEVYGLDDKDWDISMNAIERFTVNSSSEFAIRQFILKDEEKAMNQMLIWAKSTNEHVRRLSSEGCRSRLPWAVALPSFKKDPSRVLEILEILKDDESKYVQKSVANNINDISKDNENIVLELIKNWRGVSKSRDWILKHGSRTLLKTSHQETLELFGYTNTQDIFVENFVCDKKVKLGDELHFSFDINAKKNIEKLRVEYKLEFLRANAKHNSKVFKIGEYVNFKGVKTIEKSYSFKTITTRKYYLGVQKLSILINGKVFQTCSFELVK